MAAAAQHGPDRFSGYGWHGPNARIQKATPSHPHTHVYELLVLVPSQEQHGSSRATVTATGIDIHTQAQIHTPLHRHTCLTGPAAPLRSREAAAAQHGPGRFDGYG
jgi:hypothetical protein